MVIECLSIDAADVRKLLGAASGDGALLYLYIHSGGDPADAAKALHFSQSRMSCAAATLRQLGLWPEERKNPIAPGERPSYSEKDVLEAMDGNSSFRMLYGEVQRLLGRNLNTEELKILLGFVRYLGLPAEVISVLEERTSFYFRRRKLPRFGFNRRLQCSCGIDAFLHRFRRSSVQPQHCSGSGMVGFCTLQDRSNRFGGPLARRSMDGCLHRQLGCKGS